MTAFEGNILVVDDELSIRKVLCTKLRREGFECNEAESAEMALKKLQESTTDLVILDIHMPGKSGVELLEEIKSGYFDTAVIMATAFSDIKIATQCMKQGAYDYLTKPFDLNSVVMTVRKALEKRKFEVDLKKYRQRLEEQVAEQSKEIRGLSLNAVEALVNALEAKDEYTAGHSRRVTDLAIAIGREVGLSQTELEDLHYGGLLHDIGKIAIDPRVQNKPDRLTEAEYKYVSTHTKIGSSIVRPMAKSSVAEIIAHHHDYWDGGGLDQTISGNDIPIGARILTIADSFDAMTSDRPYRKAMTVDSALIEITRCSGTQFDPLLVTKFLKTSIVKEYLKRQDLVRGIGNAIKLVSGRAGRDADKTADQQRYTTVELS